MYDFRTVQGTGHWTDNCNKWCDELEDDIQCEHEEADNYDEDDEEDF